MTLITDSIADAAGFLRAGEVIAFPTETVYGLGASIGHIEAIQKIYKVKNRPKDNPLILHVSKGEQITELSSHISKEAEILIEHCMPGPLTIVLPKADSLSSEITCGLDTVAVRMPSCPIARQLIHTVRDPVAASSANLSGKPTATRVEHVRDDLEGLIPCILSGEQAEYGLESTVLDCTLEGQVRLLRSGSVSIEQIESLGLNVGQDRGDKVLSPGMKYKHYSPKAKVIILSEQIDWNEYNLKKAYYIGLHSEAMQDCAQQHICRDIREYAQMLFTVFRKADQLQMDYVFCEMPESVGLGLAIRERLLKAS